MHIYVWKTVSMCRWKNKMRSTFLLIYSKIPFVFLKFVAAFICFCHSVNDAEGGLYTVTYTYSDFTSHTKIQPHCNILYIKGAQYNISTFQQILRLNTALFKFFLYKYNLKMMLCTKIWIINLSSYIFFICKIAMIFYLQSFFHWSQRLYTSNKIIFKKSWLIFSHLTVSINFLPTKSIVIDNSWVVLFHIFNMNNIVIFTIKLIYI